MIKQQHNSLSLTDGIITGLTAKQQHNSSNITCRRAAYQPSRPFYIGPGAQVLSNTLEGHQQASPQWTETVAVWGLSYFEGF